MSTIIQNSTLEVRKTSFSKISFSALMDHLGFMGGIAFVILFFTAGSMVPDPPVDTYQTMADFYKNNEAAFLKSIYIQELAFMCFILFVSSFFNLTFKASKKGVGLPVVVLSAGLLTALMMMLSQATQGATALMAGRDADPELIRAMDEIAHIIAHFLSAPLGVFLLASSAAIVRYKITPRWFSLLSISAGITLLAAGGTYSSKELLHSLGVLSILLFVLWTLLISVTMFLRNRKGFFN